MIRVGILGATGYMGGEVLRVLLGHPEVEIAWASARHGRRMEDYHPNLQGCGLHLVTPEAAEPVDMVFMALPTAASISLARRYRDAGSRVIDLGAAFRLAHRATWESVYGMGHDDWALAEEAVYGIPELHAAGIETADLVANPGCFSSATILSLAPLLAAGWVDPRQLVVTGISGTAGVGAALSRAAHHPEIGNNLVPYNVVDHRHSYEMEQELAALHGSRVRVHFTPIYAPITRGILAICHAFPLAPFTREEGLELYREFYAGQPFVKIVDAQPRGEEWDYRPWPWVAATSGSNYCHIGLSVDDKRGRVVVFGALDSLGKGGAQVGIENMNLMFGLPRETGLGHYARHPA